MTVYKRWTVQEEQVRRRLVEAGPLDWATFWLGAGGVAGTLAALWLGWI